jgi:hypothetical protein
MNREDIIRMAQETGVTAERVRDLVNFASLVASAEREACAKVCAEDGVQAMDFTGGTFVGGYFSKKIIDRGEA